MSSKDVRDKNRRDAWILRSWRLRVDTVDSDQVN